MAVPKVAVIALVAIVAIPILLGYALNFNEVTTTDYKAAGDLTNVTPLLQTSTEYNYANGDVYNLNTNFKTPVQNSNRTAVMPYYVQHKTDRSTLFLNQNAQTTNGSPPSDVNLADYYYYYLYLTGTFTLQIYTDNYLQLTINNTTSVYISYDDSTYTLYANGNKITHNNIRLVWVNPQTNNQYLESYFKKTDSVNSAAWVDFAAGFKFLTTNTARLILPENTVEFTMSIDLDSMLVLSYSTQTFNITFNTLNTLKLHKINDASGTHYDLQYGSDPAVDIYTDPSISNNTYQLIFSFKKLSEDASNQYFNLSIIANYVGQWPSLIGKANTYQSYTIVDQTVTKPLNYVDWHQLNMSCSGMAGQVTPIVRIDDAIFKAFEYPIISEKTYDPAAFADNPSTTISDLRRYGTSIEFGGNTYTISNGNITLGTHQYSLNGMTFESVPNGTGTGYINRINGINISTTADPSQIAFNGMWSANISTQSMESYTYTKTEWIAGEFAWDGIDTNFLIVGLITCLGAFVALGIYARRTRSGGIIPLMIVTGCAAAVFFIMI